MMDYDDQSISGSSNEGSGLSEAPSGPYVPVNALAPAGAITLLPNADNAIVLPDGVTLDDIEVQGRNLVIRAPDGRVYIIPDGAISIPEIVVDGVSVPPLNLAALLLDPEIEPAAGTVSSSGGNFSDPVDPIQDAFGLGDLLPYTELQFPVQQDEEVISDFDDEPTVSDNPPVVLDDEAATSPYAAPNPGGGDDADPDTVNDTGTLGFDFGADGAGTVLLVGAGLQAQGDVDPTDAANDGVFTEALSNDGQTLTISQVQNGAHVAVLEVSLSDSTSGNYTVEQLRPIFTGTISTDEEEANFTIVYRVTDRDGDTADGTLSVSVDDDTPSIEPNEEAVPSVATDDTDTPDDVAGPVDFSGLFTSSFGADGPAADALVYGLTITGGVNGTDSGLVDTLSGDAILLRLVGTDTIEGYLENDDTTVAFTITVDATGGVSLEQDRSVVHDDPADPVEDGTVSAPSVLDAGLINLTATATDGDGDTATNSRDITGVSTAE